jgi:hypothetical protein
MAPLLPISEKTDSMPEAAIIPIRVLPFMQILVTGLQENRPRQLPFV